MLAMTVPAGPSAVDEAVTGWVAQRELRIWCAQSS